MNIKEQLRATYLKKWPQFKQAIESDNNFNKNLQPHLLSVTPVFEKEWREAKLRIMVYGISTNGWNCKKDIYNCPDNEAIDAIMSFYEAFYFQGGNWEYGEPFWNYFYALSELIKYKINPSTSLIWNNVFKTSEQYAGIEQSAFDLAKEEIEILKPHVIIVMGYNAGKSLHHRLSNVNYDYSGKTINHFTKNENRKLFLFDRMEGYEYPNLKDFLKKFIVTYHPNAHGNAGIKLKLIIDKLESELKDI